MKTHPCANLLTLVPLLSAAACHPWDGAVDLFSGLELTGPFEADLTQTAPSSSPMRAALFAEDQEVTGTDDYSGEQVTEIVSLSVDHTDGSLSYWAYLDSVTLDPLQMAQGSLEHTVFTLPSLQEDTYLVAVVWLDANDDGRLTLGTTEETSEVARTIHLDDGSPYYLTFYGFWAKDGTYSATAVSPDFVNLLVTTDQLTGWTAQLPVE